MTLCKYRPQRTYGEQFIFDEIDVRGAMKYLKSRAQELADEGEIDGLMFTGAYAALSTLMDMARDGTCDYWTDFQREFERRIGTMEEEGENDGS